MSQSLGALGPALAALSAAVGSRLRLQPASFRGVPFLVDVDEGTAGRRLVIHEFPLRDSAYLEDLGRLPRTFRLTAFVIDPLPGTLINYLTATGGDFIDQRDALLDAIDGDNTAATLMHPTMGAISCRASTVRWREHLVEGYGACEFLIEFVRDDGAAALSSASDTISALLGGVASILPLISAAYETVVLAVVSPAALLGQIAGAMLGLPPSTIATLAGAIAAIYANPTDLVATAAAVQAVTQGMAANVLAAQAAALGGTGSAAGTGSIGGTAAGAQAATVTVDDPVAGTPFYAAPPADPSGGLTTLAAWGGTLPPIAGTTAQAALQAAQQAAVVALIQGNAVAALAQVYAQSAWPSANAAADARTQLLGLLDAQTEAAAASGADDLYRGWRALTALAMRDMIARAQSLPSLSSYATGTPLPAVALAQLLYQDPTRADQLAALNDVPHPLFMPAAGVALST